MVPRFRVSLYLIAVIAVIGSVSAKPSLHSTCDELPGKTIDVQETSLDSPIQYTHWNSHNSSYLWLFTENCQLYRSKNGGADLENALQPITDSPEDVIDIAFGGVNESSVWIVGSNNLWVSRDYGEMFTLRNSVFPDPSYALVHVAPHPVHSEWAVALLLTKECTSSSKDAYGPKCWSELRSTRDGGKSWTLVHYRVYTVLWNLESVHEDALLLIVQRTGSTPFIQGVVVDMQLVESVDFIASPPDISKRASDEFEGSSFTEDESPTKHRSSKSALDEEEAESTDNDDSSSRCWDLVEHYPLYQSMYAMYQKSYSSVSPQRDLEKVRSFREWGTTLISSVWTESEYSAPIKYVTRAAVSTRLIMTQIYWIKLQDAVLYMKHANRISAGNYEITLHMSFDGGSTTQEASFFHSDQIKDYLVLPSSDNTAFVQIVPSTGSVGPLYSSRLGRTEFSKLLDRVYHNQYESSFGKVESLDGVYIANILVKVGEEDVPQTVRTFSQGSEWRPIDGWGSCNISSGCHLLLDSGKEGKVASFLSMKSAVGIVVANGMIEDERALSGVYLSRDGGLTFSLILDDMQWLGMGDHGALTVMVEEKRPTSLVWKGTTFPVFSKSFFTSSSQAHLSYSWDQGLSYEKCQFTSKGDVEITGILSQPDPTSTVFILIGKRTVGAAQIGISFFVDFSGLHERPCTLFADPEDSASDYEKWSPVDLEGKNCILGVQKTYIRKKQTAECYNTEEYEPVTQLPEHCICTREDFECAYCFEPTETGECALACQELDIFEPPEPCDQVYIVPSGYVKVPGDVCLLEEGNSQPIWSNPLLMLPCPTVPFPTPSFPQYTPSPIVHGGSDPGGSGYWLLIGGVFGSLFMGLAVVVLGLVLYHRSRESSEADAEGPGSKYSVLSTSDDL